jgi:hypothetical protein
MPKIFIVDIHKNISLLRLTETKIFFSNRGNRLDWTDNCQVVNDIAQITDDQGLIINSGEIATEEFRKKFLTVDTLVDCRGDPTLVRFPTNYNYYNTDSHMFFNLGSVHYEILKNLYLMIRECDRLVYLENTEDYHKPIQVNPNHFYGLASGWKSIQLVWDLGIKSLKSITIFDINERQLEYQKYLHSCSTLPSMIDIAPPVEGIYDPPTEIKEFWPTWHAADVNFKLLDLMETPIFPENSFVWFSNAFRYEPNIFEMGWQACKTAKQSLLKLNKSCIFIDNKGNYYGKTI